jgi:uncharacterized protein
MIAGRKNLPYPPWWKQRAAERKSVLDSAVERLRQYFAADATIVKALVFGSYAADALGPKSDLDVIVIQESAMPQLTRTAELYVALYKHLGMAIDLIVYTPEEFDRLSKTRSFVIQAVAQGRWIYARASA